MSHKIGQSFFDGLRDVVLRHSLEPGSVEASGAVFTHRQGDGGREYVIDNALIGNRAYSVVAAEGDDDRQSLEISSKAYDEDIYIKDSDGNGVVDEGDVVAVCSNHVCGSITPPEEQGVYSFVQHDLLAGIVEDPGLSGFSLFMGPSMKDDTPDRQLQSLTPSMYHYVVAAQAYIQAVTFLKGFNESIRMLLSGRRPAYVRIERASDADSFSIYLLPISELDNSSDPSECGPLSEICDSLKELTMALDKLDMSFRMLMGKTVRIDMHADGEIYDVNYPTYLPDGRVISRVFLEADDGRLEYSNDVMINPRLPSPDEIGDDDGLRREVVTVMDPTGVDWRQPVLASKLAWNYADPPDGFDNDGNGFTDDFLGWDFRDDDNIPFDYGTDLKTEMELSRGTVASNPFSHGTAVAYVASNGKTPIRVLPLRVTGNSLEWVKGAVLYARGAGSRLVNMSFGAKDGFCGSLSPLGDEIERNRDMLFIAAAGNYGLDLDNDKRHRCRENDPHDNLLTVAAIDEDGNWADSSNFGHKSVELAAPGVDVHSIEARMGGDESWDDTWHEVSGTSFSAPAVANAVAGIWYVAPHLDVQRVLRILEQSSRRENSLVQRVLIMLKYCGRRDGSIEGKVSWGALDDAAAVRYAKGMVNFDEAVSPCSGMFSDRSTLSLYQFLTECLL